LSQKNAFCLVIPGHFSTTFQPTVHYLPAHRPLPSSPPSTTFHSIHSRRVSNFFFSNNVASDPTSASTFPTTFQPTVPTTVHRRPHHRPHHRPLPSSPPSPPPSTTVHYRPLPSSPPSPPSTTFQPTVPTIPTTVHYLPALLLSLFCHFPATLIACNCCTYICSLPSLSWCDHTWATTPDPIRTPQLSAHGPE
jgi:hypothetical protein